VEIYTFEKKIMFLIIQITFLMLMSLMNTNWVWIE